MAEINVTPLVDVMLALLIVFIVTAPLLMQAVKIDLPRIAQVAPLKKNPNCPAGDRRPGNGAD